MNLQLILKTETAVQFRCLHEVVEAVNSDGLGEVKLVQEGGSSDFTVDETRFFSMTAPTIGRLQYFSYKLEKLQEQQQALERSLSLDANSKIKPEPGPDQLHVGPSPEELFNMLGMNPLALLGALQAHNPSVRVVKITPGSPEAAEMLKHFQEPDQQTSQDSPHNQPVKTPDPLANKSFEELMATLRAHHGLPPS